MFGSIDDEVYNLSLENSQDANSSLDFEQAFKYRPQDVENQNINAVKIEDNSQEEGVGEER